MHMSTLQLHAMRCACNGGHLDALCSKAAAATATVSPKHRGSALVPALVPAACSKTSKCHLSWAKIFDHLVSECRVDQ